ncbi:MAG TPA: DUF416 family protein [Nitrososphaera sp.]|jgi:hypothetical protein|nr:DUF416 family protein [Nitrososphaera sp.]
MSELPTIYEADSFLRLLRTDLDGLPKRAQVAFAAWVSERLWPYYVALARRLGSPGEMVLQNILDRVWQYIEGDKEISVAEAANFFEALGQLEKGEEGCCSEWEEGIDSLGASWLAVEAVHGNAADCGTRAASIVLNRIDQVLTEERLGRQYVLAAQEAQDLLGEIDQHPEMERARQRFRNIVDILKSSSLEPAEVRSIRQEASRDYAG